MRILIEMMCSKLERCLEGLTDREAAWVFIGVVCTLAVGAYWGIAKLLSFIWWVIHG